jgi:hypothetical protein
MRANNSTRARRDRRARREAGADAQSAETTEIPRLRLNEALLRSVREDRSELSDDDTANDPEWFTNKIENIPGMEGKSHFLTNTGITTWRKKTKNT